MRFGRIWKRRGDVPRQKLGRESSPGGWCRDPKGIEDSLNHQWPASSAGGWEMGWEHRKPARLSWSCTLLADHHPACFIPVLPTPLIPATQDSLCHLTSHSPKMFLSARLTLFPPLGKLFLALLPREFLCIFQDPAQMPLLPCSPL